MPKAMGRQALLTAIRVVLEGVLYLPTSLIGAIVAEAKAVPVVLTHRQTTVLRLLCEGLANKEIAMRLALSEKTVKTHLSLIFRVLGVANRAQAINAAHREGIVAMA